MVSSEMCKKHDVGTYLVDCHVRLLFVLIFDRLDLRANFLMNGLFKVFGVDDCPSFTYAI